MQIDMSKYNVQYKGDEYDCLAVTFIINVMEHGLRSEVLVLIDGKINSIIDETKEFIFKPKEVN